MWGVTDKNILHTKISAKNEYDVVDLEPDVEEDVVENQQPYYIMWVNNLKDGV